MKSVYRCWACKSQIESWFLEKADFKSDKGYRNLNDFVQKGDHYFWKWNNWDIIKEGQLLDANGKDFISFTFGSGCSVDVQLKEVGNMTEVVLTQKNIPTDEENRMNIYVGCITGWTFWLTNLKAYLEHDITLHAKGLQKDETTNLVNS